MGFNLFSETGLTISFYVLVLILLMAFRKRFKWQGIVGLIRTKLGLKQMTSIAIKYRKLLKVLGIISIIIGFLGMGVITGILLWSFWLVITNPQAPATFVPVLPGVKVPGSPIKFPLFKTLIAIFIAVVVHEFSHGILAVANKIKIKSSGFALFGPLPGAFVEIDEKTLGNEKPIIQHSVFSAGPFGNIITAIVIILVLSIVFVPLTNNIVKPMGFEILDVSKNSPAENASLKPGLRFNSINNQSVLTVGDFQKAVKNLKPGQKVLFSGISGSYNIKTTALKENPKIAFIGITIKFYYKPGFLPWLFLSLTSLLYWVLIINLGLGLANLLPLGPLDGGRMLLTGLTTMLSTRPSKRKPLNRFSKHKAEALVKSRSRLRPSKRVMAKALKLWGFISWTLVVLLVVTILLPILRNIGLGF